MNVLILDADKHREGTKLAYCILSRREGGGQIERRSKKTNLDIFSISVNSVEYLIANS